MTDRLFLINPGWHDDQGGIRYLDHPRPRPPVIDLVGEAHQSCPLLVLDGAFDWPEAETSAATGQRFLQDEAILPYLAARYGVGLPHP